jgi:heptosyltransferase II
LKPPEGRGNFKLIRPANILVRVPNWLGDTVMAAPAVSAVRKIFPRVRLTILAREIFAPFWRDFPGVDQVLSLGAEHRGVFGFFKKAAEIKKHRFDTALILPVSFSSAFLPFLAGIPVRIGWSGEARDLFLTHLIDRPNERKKHLVLEYIDLVQQAFGKTLVKETVRLSAPRLSGALKESAKFFGKSSPNKRWIALAPGATYGLSKRWPLANWMDLVKLLLAEKKESLLILGGKEETEYLEPLVQSIPQAQKHSVISLVGRTTPLQLAAVLKQCRLLITNDTGPMHLAAAVGTPTVALFGSSSPAWTGPFGKGHQVIYKNVECSPCFQKICPIGYECLTGISVDAVIKAVQKA